MPGDYICMHTACCGGHWELTYNPDTQEYGLQCEICGKPLCGVEISGPPIDVSEKEPLVGASEEYHED